MLNNKNAKQTTTHARRIIGYEHVETNKKSSRKRTRERGEPRTATRGALLIARRLRRPNATTTTGCMHARVAPLATTLGRRRLLGEWRVRVCCRWCVCACVCVWRARRPSICRSSDAARRPSRRRSLIRSRTPYPVLRTSHRSLFDHIGQGNTPCECGEDDVLPEFSARVQSHIQSLESSPRRVATRNEIALILTI